MSFITELKRRKVFQVAGVYAMVAWLLVQVITAVEEPLSLPDWSDTFVIICLAIGFPITLIISWAFNLTSEGLIRDHGEEAAAQATGKMIEYVLIGLLMIAVLTLLYREFAPGPGDAPEAVVAPERTQSIAVLPFINQSPDPEQEYFADGLSEELINRLAELSGLLVSGRTSSFYFKGKDEDLATIGAALDVEHVLEGSVRKDGERLRVTAQLLNTSDGFQLWGETFDRNLDDIFAIQEEISEAVATALSITLGVGELGRMPDGTTSVEAYNEVLLGNALYRQFTGESVLQATEHFRRATEIDPEYALAYARLADIYSTARFAVGSELSYDWPQRSREAIDIANRLAPDSPRVRNTTAFRQNHLLQWENVERTLNSGAGIVEGTDVSLISTYSGHLGNVGRTSETIPLLQRAKRLDPLSGGIAWYLGHFYIELGRLDEAIAELDRAVAIGNYLSLISTEGIMVALLQDDMDLLANWIQLARDNDSSALVLHDAMVGYIDNPGAARAWLEDNREQIGSLATNDTAAIWAAWFGHDELAVELLGAGRDTAYIWNPLFSESRKLPGFREFVREIGLVDYWREFGWGEHCRPVGEDDFECF